MRLCRRTRRVSTARCWTTCSDWSSDSGESRSSGLAPTAGATRSQPRSTIASLLTTTRGWSSCALRQRLSRGASVRNTGSSRALPITLRQRMDVAKLEKEELEFRRDLGELDDAEFARRVEAPSAILKQCQSELDGLEAQAARFLGGFGDRRPDEPICRIPSPPQCSPVSPLSMTEMRRSSVLRRGFRCRHSLSRLRRHRVRDRIRVPRSNCRKDRSSSRKKEDPPSSGSRHPTTSAERWTIRSNSFAPGCHAGTR